MITLMSTLEVYDEEELGFYARRLGIQFAEKPSKKVCAERIAAALLSPSVMMARLGTLSDEEIALLEKAAAGPFKVTVDEKKRARRIDALDYAFLTKDQVMVMADDVREVYSAIRTPEFEEYRRKSNWLLKCLCFCDYLYGITPVETLHKIYETKPNFYLDRDGLQELFEKLPQDMNRNIWADTYVIYGNYRNQGRAEDLLMTQKGKEYYIPSHQQVQEFWDNGYFPSEPSYGKLEHFFRNRLGLTFDQAREKARAHWQSLQDPRNAKGFLSSAPVDGWVKEMGDKGLEISNDEYGDLIILQQELTSHSRLLANRGYSPIELGTLR